MILITMADFNGQGFDPVELIGEAPAEPAPAEEFSHCEETFIPDE